MPLESRPGIREVVTPRQEGLELPRHFKERKRVYYPVPAPTCDLVAYYIQIIAHESTIFILLRSNSQHHGTTGPPDGRNGPDLVPLIVLRDRTKLTRKRVDSKQDLLLSRCVLEVIPEFPMFKVFTAGADQANMQRWKRVSSPKPRPRGSLDAIRLAWVYVQH